MSEHDSPDQPPAFVIAAACDGDQLHTIAHIPALRAMLLAADDWQGASLCWWSDFESWRQR